MTRRKKPNNLSIDKFHKLLQDSGYSVISVYCEIKDDRKGDVRFIECRSPTYHKKFILRVSSKYALKSGEFKKHYLSDDVDVIPPQIKQYLNDLKGSELIRESKELTNCHLFAISNSKVYTSIYDPDGGNNISSYLLDVPKSVDRLVKENDDVSILKNRIQQISSAFDEQNFSEEENEIEEDSGKEDFFSSDEESSAVELEFVEEKNEPPKIEEIMSSDSSSESLEEEFVEDIDVDIGEIYIMCDIRSFHKRINSFEKDLIEWSDRLDNNERSQRHLKVDKIKELCNRLPLYSENRMKELEEKEKSLKEEIPRISSLLIEVENLIAKAKKNPKCEESVPELRQIEQEAKQTLKELTSELMVNKDSIIELLTSIQSSLERLVKL